MCKEVMGDSPALQSYQQAASTAALKRMLDTTRLPDAPSASSVAYAKASHTSWMSKVVQENCQTTVNYTTKHVLNCKTTNLTIV